MVVCYRRDGLLMGGFGLAWVAVGVLVGVAFLWVEAVFYGYV